MLNSSFLWYMNSTSMNNAFKDSLSIPHSSSYIGTAWEKIPRHTFHKRNLRDIVRPLFSSNHSIRSLIALNQLHWLSGRNPTICLHSPHRLISPVGVPVQTESCLCSRGLEDRSRARLANNRHKLFPLCQAIGTLCIGSTRKREDILGWVFRVWQLSWSSFCQRG
jgi:hypothetical protein